MVNGGLSTPNDFVRMVSSAAAKAFNVYPRKGLVAPGSDADVIVFDPTLRHTLGAATHHSAVDVNVYEGMHVTGKVCAVGAGFARGCMGVLVRIKTLTLSSHRPSRWSPRSAAGAWCGMAKSSPWRRALAASSLSPSFPPLKTLLIRPILSPAQARLMAIWKLQTPKLTPSCDNNFANVCRQFCNQRSTIRFVCVPKLK